MISSISSSEPVSGSEAAKWRRWLLAFFSVPVLGVLLILALMIAVDPYDSGKFGLLGIAGVDDGNTRTAIPSRARDPQFDSAVIGNSTIQRINPAELSRATGLRFVQLYMIGASPNEELAVLDLFVRNHPRPGALVIGADPLWCRHDDSDPALDFPDWLYGTNLLAYGIRVISWQGLEHAFQRISIGLRWHRRQWVDGFFNYEEIVWPPGLFRVADRPRDPPPAKTDADRHVFPAIARLDAAIKKLPPDIPVVLIVPPTLYPTIPTPGTIGAMEQQACNAALARIVAGRPRSNFINYRVDNFLTRDRANFADFIHYRTIIAEKISEGIVASLRLGAAARIDF